MTSSAEQESKQTGHLTASFTRQRETCKPIEGGRQAGLRVREELPLDKVPTQGPGPSPCPPTSHTTSHGDRTLPPLPPEPSPGRPAQCDGKPGALRASHAAEGVRLRAAPSHVRVPPQVANSRCYRGESQKL